MTTIELTAKLWLKTNYGHLWEICRERPHQVYFDPRNWTADDIREFWEDLAFVDYETYTTVPIRKKVDRYIASSRYEKWKQSRPFD
jgi:hypothetical protein